jgi:hypothetical protein
VIFPVPEAQSNFVLNETLISPDVFFDSCERQTEQYQRDEVIHNHSSTSKRGRSPQPQADTPDGVISVINLASGEKTAKRHHSTETTPSEIKRNSSEDRRNWETQRLSEFFLSYKNRIFPAVICRLCYDRMRNDSIYPPSSWEVLIDPGNDRDSCILKLNKHLVLSHADFLRSSTLKAQVHQSCEEADIVPINALNETSFNAITSSSGGYSGPGSRDRWEWEVMPNPITDGVWKHYLIYKSHYFPGFVCRYCYSQRNAFNISMDCSLFPWEILCANVRSPAAPGNVLFEHFRLQHPQIHANERKENRRIDRSQSAPSTSLLPPPSTSAATGNSAPNASCNITTTGNSLHITSGGSALPLTSRHEWKICENHEDTSPVWIYFFLYQDISAQILSVCKSCYYEKRTTWEVQHSSTDPAVKRKDLLCHLEQFHKASFMEIYDRKYTPIPTKEEITCRLKLNAYKRPEAVIPYPPSLPRVFNHYRVYNDVSLINLSVCLICFEAKKEDPNQLPSSWEIDHSKNPPNRSCENLTDHYLTHHNVSGFFEADAEVEEEIEPATEQEAVKNREVIEIDDDSTVGSGVNSIPVTDVNRNYEEKDRRNWPVCEKVDDDSDVIWKHFLVYEGLIYPAVVCRYCYEEKKDDSTASPTSWEMALDSVSLSHSKSCLMTHLLQFHRNDYLRVTTGRTVVAIELQATEVVSSPLSRVSIKSGVSNNSSSHIGQQEHKKSIVYETLEQKDEDERSRIKGVTENIDIATKDDENNEKEVEDSGIEESDDESLVSLEEEKSLVSIANDESLVSIDDDESLVSIDDDESLVSIDDEDKSLVSIHDIDSDRRHWEVCERTQPQGRRLGVVWRYFLIYKDRKVKQSVCKACYHEKKNNLSCRPDSWEVNSGDKTYALAMHLRRYHYASYVEIRDQLPVSQTESEHLLTTNPDALDGHEERRNWEVCENPGMLRSPTWKHFLIYKDHEVDESICKVCYQDGKDKLSCPPSLWEIKRGNQTTSMNAHLRKFHHDLYAEVYPFIRGKIKDRPQFRLPDCTTKSELIEKKRGKTKMGSLRVCEKCKSYLMELLLGIQRSTG